MKHRLKTKPGDPWHDVELARVAEFDRWSDGWKRRLGWAAGLTVLKVQRDTYGDPPRRSWSVTVAARHWPHLLCWDWYLQFRLQRGWFHGRRFFFRFDRAYGDRGWTLRLLWLFYAHYATQTYDWMPAQSFRDQAPKIYPLYEGDTRAPAAAPGVETAGDWFGFESSRP